MKNPTISTWLAILLGHLTQYDEKMLAKPGYWNPYSLAHYCGAIDRIEKDLKGRLDSTSGESLDRLLVSIGRNFHAFQPINAVVRKIARYRLTGKFPTYPTLRTKRNP